MHPKPLAGLLLAAWCGTLSAPGQSTNNSPPPAPRRPSIILIMADDLGYGDIGCYGQSRIKTPNIDRLAAEGIRFTDFYAGSTVCSPSRATLMLGQHTGHVKIRGNARGASLSPDDVTLASVLKNSGYRTALLGKWGLAEEGSPGVPQRVGFDEFVGYLSNVEAHNYYPDFIWRYDPPRTNHGGFDGKMAYPENGGAKKNTYVPDLLTKAALSYIKINKPDQFNRYRPFFLFLSYNIPHANNEEGRRTGNGMEVPGDAPYSDEQWSPPEKNKAAMITRMDADIGRILEQLKQSRIETNTIVIFTSDNGPHREGGVDPKFHNSSGGLRGIKRDLYEGGIRVPMIVRWPQRIKPGQVSDFPWAMWDLLPTAADMALTKPPENTDGISVYPLLIGRAQTNRHDFLYWEFHERGFQQAARMGDWKAVRPQRDEPLELYNLKTDLSEKENVAQKNPEVVAKFENYFKNARTDDPQWPMKKPEVKGTNAPAARQ
ncbi:MAG TPA: arylsulfatase [Verrucomicrobiae bacterium]|nr:arylsulfatase [Verrucomicrobiae bacterium]